MNTQLLVSKATKIQYSETEAAEELGVSVERLRMLIRSHVVETEEDLTNVSIASFHPSDLLLLRILAGAAGTEPQP
ncbi:MAG: hypothetical protein ABI165_04195 [Bryobacteraceae bacterium]